MILLICNSSGLPFYNKNFGGNNIHIEERSMHLISGLISAVSGISKLIFNEDIVEFNIGRNKEYKITIIVNENISSGKSILFVYLSEGKINLHKMKSLASAIFIQAKTYLINGENNLSLMREKIDRIIKNTTISF